MSLIITKTKEIINNIKEKFIKTKENKICSEIEPKEASNFKISEKQKSILSKLYNSRKTQDCIRIRSQLILLFIEKKNKTIVAQEAGTYWSKVHTWVSRYITNIEVLDKIEKEEPRNLKAKIIDILSDKYRSGRSLSFTSIQIASIIFVSLQDPKTFDIPVSNWSAELLKIQVIEMEIVKSISNRQISRYLKVMDINVYRYQGWLNSMDKNENIEEFKIKIKEISELYEKSEELSKNGIILTCSDEKMSIQALEHKHSKKPVKIGSVEKVEQEYKRNGTTGLIATRLVNTGKIIVSNIQPTRTEDDYVNHIKELIKTDKEAKRVLIMDQLNTHMSEGLVRLIATECDINIDLGIKKKCGILKSMKTRKEFLEGSDHRIRIVYTPKHTSWMNQIEIWFGIMTKQLLNRRSSFKNLDELENKIREYIEFYNKNLAKKFKWNHGKILNI